MIFLKCPPLEIFNLKNIHQNNLSDLLSKVRDHKIPLRVESEWKKFLKCEKIPNPQVPSDVRAFLYKFQLDYEEYFDHNVNWWLKTDDRSDMHQDETRNPDIRRRIVEKVRKPIGSFYDKQIRLMMKAYESLEDSIRRKKVSESRLNDLIKVSFKSSFMFHFHFHFVRSLKKAFVKQL